MQDIPTCVENALNDWDALAFVAYDWYEKMGRLVVGIEQDETDPGRARLLAAVYDFQAGKPDSTTAKLLSEYDPNTEIIIQFIDKKSRVRTQRVRTAPGGRHPKRVFFFEMLRRINEEPDTIDLEDLPGWFVKAVEALEAAEEIAW